MIFEIGIALLECVFGVFVYSVLTLLLMVLIITTPIIMLGAAAGAIVSALAIIFQEEMNE